MLATWVWTLYTRGRLYSRDEGHRNPDRLKPHIEYLPVFHQIVQTKWSISRIFCVITLQASSIKHDNEEKRENKTRNRSKKQNKTSEIGIFLCHYRTINVKSNLTKTKLISELFGGLTGDDKKEVGIADKMNQHICSINKKTGQEHPSYKHLSRTIHRKEGIYTFRVLILWLKNTIYRVAAKLNTSKSCGPAKSQVCFLNWPSHTF